MARSAANVLPSLDQRNPKGRSVTLTESIAVVSVIPKGAVLLTDNKGLQPADNPVFLMRKDKATSAALTGDPFGELPAWLELLAGFDVVMLIAGAGTYGFLLEE